MHFGGGLDGVPQSITDVRLFCVRVILSLVEGSTFCSLKARQMNALVHVFLQWKYGENAAGCLLPLPLLFPLPGRLRDAPDDWTSLILRPFKVSCTSFSGRESRPWWRCAIETFSLAVWVHSQSESVHFLALPPYYFWLLENSVLFVFAWQLALNAARIPWIHHLPWS